MLYAIIGMLVIIADQALKFWVAGHLTPYTEIIPVIPGILSLQSVQNSGAAFGFLSGSGARIPFIILAGVFAVAVIIALATNLISGKLARWCIVLVTAGGLSNCIDRVISGYVIDMFKFEFINFPVFNLADVFITVFAILFALAVIFGKTRKDVDEDEDFLEDEEEEEAPKVSRRKARREKRRAAELEEEGEDLEPAPAPKKAKKKARGRKAAEEAEPEAAVEAPAPKKAVAKPAPAEDPFADWDRANATASAAKARRSEVIAAARQPSGASASSAQRASAVQPVRNNAQVAAAASAQSAGTASAARPASQAARPAASARPAAASPTAAPKASAAKPTSASKPAAKPVVEEEFSLDDILNEFK